mmetsp:Transcript_13665/g.16605  ORF Transcript_13665/g.16605 Transcript_13665/m.16605 type:complete len:247 (-) Transcript_13665:132-872(-)
MLLLACSCQQLITTTLQQAICDHKRRFLAISILYGAASSDLLAFEGSPLRVMLEKEGFLAPGLCIFGDNAYVNREFLATPYPNVSGNKEKDAYNFFHSQLRINIECAFGILVSRWGFLKKKAPKKYSIAKIISTVSCLCSLHNFLIDNGNESYALSSYRPTPQDALALAFEGAVDVEERMDGVRVPTLTGGGEHFDDDPTRAVRKRITRITETYQRRMGDADNTYVLPREAMFIHVVNNELRRLII